MAAPSSRYGTAPKRRRLADVNGEVPSIAGGQRDSDHSDSIGVRIVSFVSRAFTPLWDILGHARHHFSSEDHEQAGASPERRRRVASKKRDNPGTGNDRMDGRDGFTTARARTVKRASFGRSNRANGIGVRGPNAANFIVLDDTPDDEEVIDVRVTRSTAASALLFKKAAESSRATRIDDDHFAHSLPRVVEVDDDDDDVQIIESHTPAIAARWPNGHFTAQRSSHASSSLSSQFARTARRGDQSSSDEYDDALEDPSDFTAKSGLQTFADRMLASHNTPAKAVNALREAYGLGSPEAELKPRRNESYVTAVEEQDEDDVLSEGTSASRESSVEFVGERKRPMSKINEEVESSPSPQPEQSASRTISPVFVRSGHRGLVDKWKRRSTPRGTPLVIRNRTHPPGFSTSSEEFRHRLQHTVFGVDSRGEAINMGAKERYRQLLEHVGAEYVSLPASLRGSSNNGEYARVKPTPGVRLKRLDPSDMLRRGREALSGVNDSALADATLDTPSNRTVIQRRYSEQSLESDASEEVSLDREHAFSQGPSVSGLHPGQDKPLSSSVPTNWRRGFGRQFSGQSDRSVESLWDTDRDESFKARLSADQPSSILRRHRLAEHSQDAELRSRLAEQLNIERRLREQGRRDEEESLEEQLRRKLTLTGYIFRDRSIRRLKDEFVALSDEALSFVNRVWNRHFDLSEKFGENLTRKDLLTLRGLDWLNDEVINGYLQLIVARCASDTSLPKVFSFSTFFYASLASNGYPKVKRWTKKVDIFSYDILLAPIHLGAHWCLTVIDFQRKRIEYFDSMGGSNNACLETFSAYLNEESKDKKGKPFDLSGWEMEVRRDIPQQMNGSDCGMFTCKFAEFAARRAEVVFTQAHMPYYRQRMVYELCVGKLM